jgi:SSS family solute:Na+ symporter
MNTLDLIAFCGSALLIMGLGLWIGRREKSSGETTRDFFLAGSSIPWWAVGGSLIASNISAEQFIGMSGSGYAMGFAIAAYELMAAATLVLVAKYFLPIYLKNGIYTMPQFLEMRYNQSVRSGLAVFWVALFVLVNISSVLYLGAKAIEAMGIPLFWGIVGLAIYSATTSIFGGLKAVVWTEVVQVVILLVGGVVTSWLSLDAVGGGNGPLAGFAELWRSAPEKFNLLLQPGDVYVAERGPGQSLQMVDAWNYLPGLSVLVGGMWIANLYYWGMNQYIIQRALAAKSLQEAQRGVVFAALLKLVVPLIVVVPGIAAYALHAPIEKYDEAYPWMMSHYVGAGFRGIAFAALAAAVGSSVSAMVNSASTIFTLDIYRPLFCPDLATDSRAAEAQDHHLVRVGKWAAAAALLIGVATAPLLANLEQAFQFIQRYTGYISPGVVVVFLFGLFWKKASSQAAMLVVLLSIPLSVGLDWALPHTPFMDRMGLGFLILSGVMLWVSWLDNRRADDPKAVPWTPHLFRTDPLFNVSALAILAVLAALYAFLG